MSIDLTDPIFNDEAAAWAHFEAIRWPHGPVCPHCGVIDAADKITGKTARHGLYRCHECVKQFTATSERFTRIAYSDAQMAACHASALLHQKRHYSPINSSAAWASAHTERLGSWRTVFAKP